MEYFVTIVMAVDAASEDQAVRVVNAFMSEMTNSSIDGDGMEVLVKEIMQVKAESVE